MPSDELSPEARQQIETVVHTRLSRGTTRDGDPITYTTTLFKTGRRKWRAGQLARAFDPETGKLRFARLKLGTWNIRHNNPAALADLTPNYFWLADTKETEVLRDLLNEDLEPANLEVRSRFTGTSLASILSAIEAGEVDGSTAANLVASLAQVPDFSTHLADQDMSQLLVESVEIQRRRNALAELEQAIEGGESETKLHARMKEQSWIFGGRFIGEENRKRLSLRGTLDIPLIRGDNSLHVVELKGTVISRLVEPYRRAAGFVVGKDINRAVGQVQNYLRDLDIKVNDIAQELGIDCSRSSGTVVIGDCRRVAEASMESVRETLRTYNSHMSRVEVITWDELIANANHALNFSPK